MQEQSRENTLPISDANARIRSIIERETVGNSFWTSGVVRRVYTSDFGHVYFELFDEDYSLRCMVIDSVRRELGFSIMNAQEVEVYGSFRVYEKGARLEFNVEQVKWIESVLPTLHEDVEQQLRRKGLLPKAKRPIPAEIKRIALVTSRSSDARDDFEAAYHRERGAAQIVREDVMLQGQQAPDMIASAINRLNVADNRPDVIVLTRGGGRATDLAVFSDILVAEAICRSTIPIVTGIGHENDQTFADEIADLRASTPTDAAYRLAQSVREDAPLPVSERDLLDRLARAPLPASAAPAMQKRTMFVTVFVYTVLLLLILGLVVVVILWW